MKWISVAAIGLLFISAPALAPKGAQAIECSNRTVLAMAISAYGKPILDLPAEAFVVESRPIEPRIRSIKSGPRPGRLVIVLDASSSMGHDKKMQMAASVVAEMVYAIPTDWKLALLVFREQIEYADDISDKRNSIEPLLMQTLAKVKASRKGRYTALIDALKHGIDSLGKPQLGDTIFLVSDGGDNRSKTKLGEVQGLLDRGGVRLFAVGVTDSVQFRRTGEELWHPGDIGRVAVRSGGILQLVTEPEKILSRTQLLAALIANPYVIELELGRQPVKLEKLKLKLTSDANKKWKYTSLIYQGEILPCRDVAASK